MGKKISDQQLYANFYDLYSDGFDADIPIYLDLAAKYPGPVLEVGCGTGRVAAHLAAAGHEVVGIETYREKLVLARRRCEEFPALVRLHDHDLRHHPLPEAFHIVLVTLYTFNSFIDVEEQRLFLRHIRQSMRDPGIIALDCFCPLSLVSPENLGEWRTIERSSRGHRLVVRDRRELLNPLLERRTQRFRIDSGPEHEVVIHRRYIPPFQAVQLLEEAGFEDPRWLRQYDPSTASPIDTKARPDGPFLILADA